MLWRSPSRLMIQGMTRPSCNLAIKAAAEGVNGVSKAVASYSKKTAWAVFDPAKTNPQAIGAAMTAAGYPATLIK
jgi:mercuric ion binding protein